MSTNFKIKLISDVNFTSRPGKSYNINSGNINLTQTMIDLPIARKLLMHCCQNLCLNHFYVFNKSSQSFMI